MVSLRLVQLAIAAICCSARSLPLRITANGLPLKGTAVKTSTCWKTWVAIVVAFALVVFIDKADASSAVPNLP